MAATVDVQGLQVSLSHTHTKSDEGKSESRWQPKWPKCPVTMVTSSLLSFAENAHGVNKQGGRVGAMRAAETSAVVGTSVKGEKPPTCTRCCSGGAHRGRWVSANLTEWLRVLVASSSDSPRQLPGLLVYQTCWLGYTSLFDNLNSLLSVTPQNARWVAMRGRWEYDWLLT